MSGVVITPTHVIAPVDGHGVTKGKAYEIKKFVSVSATEFLFAITNDKGELINCRPSLDPVISYCSWRFETFNFEGKSLSEGVRKATPVQIIAWFILAIAILMTFAYMMQHRTNFQELVPEYTDDDGSTLFIERK